jgi:hypothetical protein
MSPDDMRHLLIVLLPLAITFGFGWYRSAREVRRLRTMLLTESPELDRLLRVEQALDAMAAQNERLIEAQDFLSRVVADRIPLPLPHQPTSPKVVTPH